MNNYAALTAIALAWLHLADAQISPAPEFAVASVKPNPQGNAGAEGSEREKITLSPVGVSMRNITLRSCLIWAYDMRDSQISGPAWLASEHFDIVANASGPVSPDRLRPMMQKLLTDRFKLELHRESKDVPVYAMTLAPKKTSKLQPATGEDSSMIPSGGAMIFRNYSMPDFADRLTSRPFKLDRLVIDKTGLTGIFDFKINFAENEAGMKHTLEGMEQGKADQVTSMLTILQEQLGLTFKPQKSPVETLVIDRAEKVPTAN